MSDSDFLAQLDDRLNSAIGVFQSTQWYRSMMEGPDTLELYKLYLRYAYHYVINTAAFSPLAARRMPARYIRSRHWILKHSAAELGHEEMALDDLRLLGVDTDEIRSERMPIGVLAWAGFFHYKVTQDNPFSVFGVLYFLEGLACAVAPALLEPIRKALPQDTGKAIGFFREHGVLDTQHLGEQKTLLDSESLLSEDKESIINTIVEAGTMKKFMVDELVRQAGD